MAEAYSRGRRKTKGHLFDAVAILQERWQRPITDGNRRHRFHAAPSYNPHSYADPHHDQGYLFLSPTGERLTDRKQVEDLVGSLTYQYTGYRLSPHQLRQSWTTWVRRQVG